MRGGDDGETAGITTKSHREMASRHVSGNGCAAILILALGFTVRPLALRLPGGRRAKSAPEPVPTRLICSPRAIE